MSVEEKDSPGGVPSIVADSDPYHLEPNEGGPGSQQPMHMQLFSTWEVRKAPVNCVPRLCTLQVSRLEVTRPLETGLGSFVLAASMKTPHRFLRSNEILLPPSGIITIPLELTFSLQYPHFLKRGGNVLQIRLQRRKRVRNRPLGGYKNLAIGLVEMSQVLQHSFQGEVKLYSEKVAEHMAVVTVGSLTSTAVDLERREHLVEVSSDDDDEDILFSDDHTDSESGDNEHHSDEAKKKFKPSTSAVLRLLHLYRPPKTRHRHPDAMMMEEEEGEVFHGSSVAFASSPSDSEEEEEEGEGLVGATPTRPTLSPFFGSDRCSMVSLPTSAKSAEKFGRGASDESPLGRGTPESSLQSRRTPEMPLKYGSLERAVQKERLQLPALPSSAACVEPPSSWDLTRGRLWCVTDSLPSSAVVVRGLEGAGEVVITCAAQEMQDVQLLLAVINFVFKHWVALVPFCIALVGDDSLVSSSLQALSQSRCPPEKLRFAIIPIVPGLMSTRLSSIDDKYEVAFPSDGQWLSNLPDSTDPLLHYVEEASSSLPLPLAQVVLRRPAAEPSSGGSPFMFSEQSLPFMCNVSIGSWDMEPADASPVPLPTSPVYGSTAVGGATETPELVLEYWNPKGQKEKSSSVKVRSVLVSYVDNILNVTATKEKKNKGIRIRKSKESETAWGSIVSLTTTQLLCRPVSKGERMAVMVDGVEREGLSVVRLQANWDLTPNTAFSIAVTADVAST